MKKILPLIVGLLLVAGFYFLASTLGFDDKTYRELDQIITSEHNQLKLDYAQMKISQKQYFEKLKELDKKKEDLFIEVRAHKFENITEHNYWHRDKLKFPSSIKTELDIINKTEKYTL